MSKAKTTPNMMLENSLFMSLDYEDELVEVMR